MRISALLEQKGTEVCTIRGGASIDDAVTELSRRQIGALVVSPGDGSIQGILSERDIVRRLHDQHGALLSEPVSSIMSTSVTTCGPEDDTEALMAIMTDRRIRHIPVVSDGRLCGIVSIGDVVKIRIHELEKDRKELVDYITAR